MKPPIDEIICGDNIEVMSGWEAECIDLTITSPPYDKTDYDENGNLVTHSDQGLRDYNGYSWDFTKVAQQLYRVTKKGGVVVWVVGDATVNGSETGSSFRQALYFMGLGFRLHDTMLYAKEGMPPLNHNRYEQEFEYLFVFSKGPPVVFNPIMEPCYLAGQKNTGTRRNGGSDNLSKIHGNGRAIKSHKIHGNIWRYGVGLHKTTSDKEAYKHPAIFPDDLARDMIISWSDPGMLVLDPFMGSGTVGKACAVTGRHYVGIETSPEFCNLSRRRIQKVKQQPRLFNWSLEPNVK